MSASKESMEKALEWLDDCLQSSRYGGYIIDAEALAEWRDAAIAEERERVRALFIDGVPGQWPDDDKDSPEDWENWSLALVGNEAGDSISDEEAWEHYCRGLRCPAAIRERTR